MLLYICKGCQGPLKGKLENCQNALKSGMIMNSKEVWKGIAIGLARIERDFVNLEWREVARKGLCLIRMSAAASQNTFQPQTHAVLAF